MTKWLTVLLFWPTVHVTILIRFWAQVNNVFDIIIKSHTQSMSWISRYVSLSCGIWMNDVLRRRRDGSINDQQTLQCSDNGLQKSGTDRMPAMPLGYRPGFRSTGCRKIGEKGTNDNARQDCVVIFHSIWGRDETTAIYLLSDLCRNSESIGKSQCEQFSSECSSVHNAICSSLSTSFVNAI